MTKLITVLLLLFFPFSLVAQVERIDTDRPDQTESAVTVPNKYFQAEIGFNRENTYGKDYDLIYPTALLKYGLNKFEFRMEINNRKSYNKTSIPNSYTNGFEPLELGCKISFWEEKSWVPKTSLIIHTGLKPLSSKAFRPDHFFIPSFRFTMQNSISSNIAIGYNLGAEWDGFTSTPSWIYTFAPGFNMGKRWYGYIELFGSIRKNELPQHNADAGLAWFASDDLKLDISAGTGISSAAPGTYIAVGGSFRINTSKKN